MVQLVPNVVGRMPLLPVTIIVIKDYFKVHQPNTPHPHTTANGVSMVQEAEQKKCHIQKQELFLYIHLRQSKSSSPVWGNAHILAASASKPAWFPFNKWPAPHEPHYKEYTCTLELNPLQRPLGGFCWVWKGFMNLYELPQHFAIKQAAKWPDPRGAHPALNGAKWQSVGLTWYYVSNAWHLFKVSDIWQWHF